MKFKTLILTVTILVGIINFSFQKEPQEGIVTVKALPQIKSEAISDFNDLLNQTIKFKEAIQNQKNVLNAYYQFRNSYNTIEFLLAYLDDEWYNAKINGAPLPKLEKKVADIRVLQPKGIQVIDELLAEELTTENLTTLKHLVENLESDLHRYDREFKHLKMSERQIFEALRYQIIRLGTMTITGFDTPGTLNSVEDAKTEMMSIQKYLNFFKEELKRTSNQDFIAESNAILNQELSSLNVSNFENLDRFKFLKEYVNPMYGLIYKVHSSLEYETWIETDNYIHSLNYESTNLFAKDFLDPFAFTSLPKDSLFTKRKNLGKILFYDPVLSSNATLSCASCHDPSKAFTDGVAKSKSIDGTDNLDRNSMMLPYSIYSEKLFWDVRVDGLERQFQHVINNKKEFHTTYSEITNRLNESSEYKAMFKTAFPEYDGIINATTLDYAIVAYVMGLGTFDSKFDESMQNREVKLNDEEILGFNLFSGKAACATCHFYPTFSGLVPPLYKESESEVLGVTSTVHAPWTLDEDKGRAGGRFGDFIDFYENSFKTVSLRNIEKTAPYMHNGAFNTLEEVMEFYNDGGGLGRGLEVPHQTLAGDSLNLNDEEQKAIIAFMKTLTDKTVFQPLDKEDLPKDFNTAEYNNR